MFSRFIKDGTKHCCQNTRAHGASRKQSEVHISKLPLGVTDAAVRLECARQLRPMSGSAP
eukprot:5623927-Amphidinium_carterae.1